MRRFRVEPEAVREVDDAFAWHITRNQTFATQLVEAIDATYQRIEEAPHTFPPYIQGTHLARLEGRRFRRYFVVFSIEPDAVRVIAVAHTSRRKGYWRNRL